MRAGLNQLIMSDTCVEGACLLTRIKRLDQRINDLEIGYDRAKRTWSKCNNTQPDITYTPQLYDQYHLYQLYYVYLYLHILIIMFMYE